jgi:uroporphyrinogen decarboxylase
MQNVKNHESAFVQACFGKSLDFTPIWLMRQAGRFMPQYRQIREKVPFLELCKNPELASEVTILAVELLGVDAAIIFADILLPLEAMGVGLTYEKGDGPRIHNPVKDMADVERLLPVEPKTHLDYVMQAITLTRTGLPSKIALIGFAGAPFTLASYLIEGGSSRHFEKTKALMHGQPDAWAKLMNILADVTANYLNEQIKAGAQAVQLFDSWVGCLSPSDYRTNVLPYMQKTIKAIDPTVPIIHFGTGTATLLELMRQAGGDVIGLDWRIELNEGWQRVGYDKAIQGNLDPAILLADKKTIHAKAKLILEQAQGRPGHIFNLGHGVLPQTPFDNVKYLVDCVHELGKR